MTSAVDVVKYMKALGHTFYGEMQAHKLLYYAQAWTLAWDGKPLFDDPIEAWKNGPVVRSVRFRTHVAADLDVPLTAQEKENIAAVVAHYGSIPGNALGDMTHQESPWRMVWGDRSNGDTCSDEIPYDLMRGEYTRQSLHGDGPQRHVVVDLTPAGRADVLASARAASRRWQRTLALLAE